MEKWFLIGGYNQQAIYCWGTEAQADRYCEKWNEKRDVNCRFVYELTDQEIEDLRLDQNNEAINLDDWEAEIEP